MNCENAFFSLLKIRAPHLRFYHTGIIILFLIGMQVAGCAPAKIQPYNANPINTYSKHVTINDLYIAIEPMSNREEQEKCFGVVLTDMGTLPVYIIAENRSVSRRFMLRDDRISLRNKKTNNLLAKPLQTDAADDSHLEGMKRTALISGNVLLSAPLLFTSLGFARNSEKVKVIQDNMFDKTLYTQTVLPGKTAAGFAYFKIADGKIDFSNTNNDSMQNLALGIQVTDEGEQSPCDFEFDLP
jgi:hypothetical protein